MKATVKKVKMPLGGDGELADMFNQMVGTGNVAITYPKYKRIEQNLTALVKMFETVAESPFMRMNPQFKPQHDEIKAFCNYALAEIPRVFGMVIPGDDAITDEFRTKFGDHYLEMRKHKLCGVALQIHKNLAMYKKNYTSLETLQHKFILTMPGVEWRPFPFTSLNLKEIFSLPSVKENTIRYFMCVLYKSFELAQHIYNELNSPDVDIDQFVNVIMANIDEIQKRPELSRCRKAFKKIRDSVVLLKERFDGYYRDFIDTNDSSIMMQHFIIDVSKETPNDPKLTQEFRTIIDYYRKMAANQITNPKVKVLFEKFNKSFEELDRPSTRVKPGPEEQAASPPSDEDGNGFLVSPVAKGEDTK